jgi:hypothetical protein
MNENKMYNLWDNVFRTLNIFSSKL